jgi:hypothetical protein
MARAVGDVCASCSTSRPTRDQAARSWSAENETLRDPDSSLNDDHAEQQVGVPAFPDSEHGL